MKRHQYTIRGIPAEVDRALRERAGKLKVSINSLILDLLSKATLGKTKFADFNDVVGAWEPDERFDAAVAEQRTVYEDDWK